jgi:sterol desaturase/sphingolipid hydroxylase (fatty acid hydroxylase superfamily)
VGLRVFENGFLEAIARSPWWLPVVVFVPLSMLALTASFRMVGESALGWFFVGVIAWTMIEYALHRFVFHLGPRDDSREEMLRDFLTHGYHHMFPRDPMRLVAPPMLSWPLAAIVFVVYRALLPSGVAFGVFAGTTAGYLAYDLIHFYVHHAHPKTALGKYLRRYHLLHHAAEVPSRFGVTSPLWDVLLGTSGAVRPEGRSGPPHGTQTRA